MQQRRAVKNGSGVLSVFCQM